MGEFNKVKYNNKYNRENYARLSVLVQLEDREKIDAHWKEKGFKSFNSYVNDLIRKDMFESNDRAAKIIHVDSNETINM